MADNIIFQEPNIGAVAHCNIANGNININNVVGGKPVLEILHKMAAPGGFHISNERYDAPKCHKDTCITVRQDLLDQVKIAVVSCIIWLYSAASAGKSAIAQSFAETCKEEGLLIGTFFFFQAAPLRNNAQRLAASLAYQLGRAIPSTRQYIAECIATHPVIFSSTLGSQLGKLFVEPLCRACKDDPTLKPAQRLVILDGLDECDRPNVQRYILNFLEKALQGTPIPIIVLVASRPEIHISSTFEALDRCASIPTFHFGLNDKYDVDGDIRLYLNDKFKETKRDHPFKKYLPKVWPCSNDVELIITKSSGQFIYAATIIRYIGHYKCNPHERLQTALDASKRFASTLRDSPFKDLDALYLQIFSTLEDQMTTLAILYLALNIGGGHDDAARCPRTIVFHLGLSCSDLEIHISDLASLMRYEGEHKPIRFFHASLQDFLVDEHCSHGLYIEQPAVHTALSKAYLCHFFQSGSSYIQLSSISTHLRLAELDPELCHLLKNLEAQILKVLKVFNCNDVIRNLLWIDHHLTEPGSSGYFSDFVKAIYNFQGDLASYTLNNTFWDQCLGAMHEVFRTQLSVYLADSNTKDLLAIVALAEVGVFPRRHLAASLSISESAFTKCREVDIFKSAWGPAPPDRFVLKILENFLLDHALSGKLSVSSERCARVTTKCLSIVQNARLSNQVPNSWSRFSNDEYVYVCAIRSLTGMLRRASQYQQLLDGLNKFDPHFQWLNQHPDTLKEAREAINTYLKTHSSTSPPSGTTQKEDPTEPAQVVHNLPIGQGIQKRARATSSDGTYAAMDGSTVAASRSSGQQAGKRPKVKKT